MQAWMIPFTGIVMYSLPFFWVAVTLWRTHDPDSLAAETVALGWRVVYSNMLRFNLLLVAYLFPIFMAPYYVLTAVAAPRDAMIWGFYSVVGSHLGVSFQLLRVRVEVLRKEQR